MIIFHDDDSNNNSKVLNLYYFRVESVDGSAKAGDDYVKVDEILVFEPEETEKLVLVKIVDDTQWEPNEEFFLKLSLTEHSGNANVQIGRISIMEITILDDDSWY